MSASPRPNPEDAATSRARKRVQAEKSFYIHLTVYICVNTFLWLSSGRPFSSFVVSAPVLGWGLGLLAHGLVVFGLYGTLRDWEEKRVRELVDEERERR